MITDPVYERESAFRAPALSQSLEKLPRFSNYTDKISSNVIRPDKSPDPPPTPLAPEMPDMSIPAIPAVPKVPSVTAPQRPPKIDRGWNTIPRPERDFCDLSGPRRARKLWSETKKNPHYKHGTCRTGTLGTCGLRRGF